MRDRWEGEEKEEGKVLYIANIREIEKSQPLYINYSILDNVDVDSHEAC